MNNTINRVEELKLKAQEIIELLKQYLPEKYKETLDNYNPDTDLVITEDKYEYDDEKFHIFITDIKEKYVLDIGHMRVVEVQTDNPSELITIARYVDKEKLKNCTFENPWTWDDAIKIIKKRMKIRRKNNENGVNRA